MQVQSPEPKHSQNAAAIFFAQARRPDLRDAWSLRRKVNGAP